jgi:hypothetical protein
MKNKTVVLVVEVPDGLEQYTPVALAHMLADAMKRSGLRNGDVCWPVRFGGVEMLAPPAPPAEPSTISCCLWHHCRKHPAFGVLGTTIPPAECPHFIAGASLDQEQDPWISWPNTIICPPRYAVVQGGSCVCLAYEPAEEPTHEAQP